MTPYPPPQPTQYAQPAPPPGAPPSGYYQQGQPYYPPPPVMAPVYVPPPGQKTFEGLKWLRYASLLSICFNALFLIGGLMAAIVVAGTNFTNPGAAIGLFGALVAVLALLAIGGILGFIAFIMALVGYYNVHQGRQEFGPQHQADVQGSVKWFAIACVMFLIQIVAGLILSVNAITGGLNPNSLATNFAISEGVSGGLHVIFVYAAAMVMQLIVARLMTQQGRSMKPMFMILSIAGAVLALVLSVASGFMFTSALAANGGLGGVSALSSIAGVISVVTSWMYYKQVQSAEQGARNMIQSGQFNPDPGGVAPPVAPAAPPM